MRPRGRAGRNLQRRLLQAGHDAAGDETPGTHAPHPLRRRDPSPVLHPDRRFRRRERGPGRAVPHLPDPDYGLPGSVRRHGLAVLPVRKASAHRMSRRQRIANHFYPQEKENHQLYEKNNTADTSN